MIYGIEDKANKQKLAIVVVGFNKLQGLRRLLSSLNSAEYETNDVPLVISIDASGNEEVYQLANGFQWEHGVKYVNIEKERLGLKNHIFQCASLSSYFKGVIILEDDLLVSPFFYHYCLSTLDSYGDCSKVAGIALYKNEREGFVGLPLQHVNNENDVFAAQTVCSWGELWNERMWNEFTTWLAGWDEDFTQIDMVGKIKLWSRAWSKFFYAYMIKNDKYFIYPLQSLSTNFNDAGGEHGGGNNSVVQVSLMLGKREYQLGEFASLDKYDVFMQNKDIPRWLGIDNDDITIDFYGHREFYKGHYILAPFDLPFKRVKGFSLSMRPWEINIKYGITGEELFLYRRESDEIITPPSRQFQLSLVSYFLRGFNLCLLERYVWDSIKTKIKNKLHFNG